MAKKQFDIHKDLIVKSVKGSRKAQYKLYELYSAAMFNICYRMMNTREEAEDLLQEAFTEAFLKLHSFRFESTFGAWLKRIVVNKCINDLKRRKAELEFCDDIGKFGNKEIEDVDLPTLNVNMVKTAMNELPKGSKLIFQLYLLEGYDHREISQILGVSESNSKSQYMRAKRRIKELLKDKIYEN
ncbi:MAG: RNA polymerase sigma factor [Chlorobi bacterium]|nr:RNA polymerase sigma factor [Chlorobiota bacterium]